MATSDKRPDQGGSEDYLRSRVARLEKALAEIESWQTRQIEDNVKMQATFARIRAALDI